MSFNLLAQRETDQEQKRQTEKISLNFTCTHDLPKWSGFRHILPMHHTSILIISASLAVTWLAGTEKYTFLNICNRLQTPGKIFYLAMASHNSQRIASQRQNCYTISNLTRKGFETYACCCNYWASFRHF